MYSVIQRGVICVPFRVHSAPPGPHSAPPGPLLACWPVGQHGSYFFLPFLTSYERNPPPRIVYYSAGEVEVARARIRVTLFDPHTIQLADSKSRHPESVSHYSTLTLFDWRSRSEIFISWKLIQGVRKKYFYFFSKTRKVDSNI